MSMYFITHISSRVLLYCKYVDKWTAWKWNKSKSSRSQIVFKIGVLKNFINFIGKYIYWNLFLIKLQAWRPATLLKRDSNTGVFLWNLQNFSEHFFLQNISGGCFCKKGDFCKNSEKKWFNTAFLLLQNKKYDLDLPDSKFPFLAWHCWWCLR